MSPKNRLPSSFRDPSGFMFSDEGIIKRVIKPIYFEQYRALNKSGFFKKLFEHNLLIKHEELFSSDTEIIIRPEQIPFIIYPYEWSFNQYKEAALLTLKLQKYSLENGFILKDASAFNITFHKGRAIFIDTLSFDFYNEGSPWRAYKQFISHFLGPLVLAHYHGTQLIQLMSTCIDGIPLKMLSSMLPLKTKLNPTLYSNIHLLAKYEDKHNELKSRDVKVKSLSKRAQINIIESLFNYIKKLKLNEHSEWGNYYKKANYSESSFKYKYKTINSWINRLAPNRIIDLGGNDGTFVRKMTYRVDLALVCDIDNNAVDLNYKRSKENEETHILPFVLDVLNPSASIGFNNKERDAFIERIKRIQPCVTLALALIHHMTLSGNITFRMSANFLASFSKYLIIEFPKRNDSWVEHLLNTKGEFKEHFNNYNITNFEDEYARFFYILEKKEIKGTNRVIYLLQTK